MATAPQVAAIGATIGAASTTQRATAAIGQLLKAWKVKNTFAPSLRNDRVPATILTGFFGSGKTTMLSRILAGDHGKRIAVIQNGFGDTAVDDALVLKRIAGTTLHNGVHIMRNGCVCFTMKHDLPSVIPELFRVAEDSAIKIDHVVFETAGAANPSPIAEAVMSDKLARRRMKLNSVITMVDATDTMQQLLENKSSGMTGQMMQQISMADRLIINKMDLLENQQDGPAHLRQLRAVLNGLNPLARVTETSHALASADILTTQLQDLQTKECVPSSEHDGIRSISIEGTQPVDLEEFHSWVKGFVDAHGQDIYQMQGIVPVAGRQGQKLAFRGVSNLVSGEFVEDTCDEMANRIVCIGRGIEADVLREGIRRCVAP